MRQQLPHLGVAYADTKAGHRVASWSLLGAAARLAGRHGILILILVLFPLAVLTFRLENNPPGFFIDESINGFEAYTVLKTGGFSSSGEFLPRLLINPSPLWGGDERNHGLYAYLVIPFIALLGMHEVAVRLTSVFLSISLLCALYFLLRAKVFKWSLLLAALWWPLASWVFLLSRIGMELIATALISTLVIWILIKMQSSERIRDHQLLLFDLLVVTLFFLYAAGEVLALGYIGFALVLLLRKHAPAWSIAKLMVSLIAILVLALPYILDRSLFFRAGELTQCIHNILNCGIRNVVGHFGYRPYFANSYVPADFAFLTHSISGTSLIPRPLAVFLVIGLAVLLYWAWKRDFFALLVLLSCLLGTIPASLNQRGFDSYRSVSLLPIIFILIPLGLDVCIRTARRLPVHVQTAALACFLLGTTYFGYRELQTSFAYEYNVGAALKTGWHYGYREVFNYFIEHYDEYDAFVVTKNVAYVPDLYIRFYDPDGLYGKIRVSEVVNKALPAVDGVSRILYAVRSDEVDIAQFTVRKTVYYPNGRDVAFEIGEPKPKVTGP